MIPVPDISQTYPKTSLTLDSRFVVGEGNARDLSGDSNTGALVSGRAVLFDGAADYIDCGAGIDLSSTGGSMSVWVKPSAINGSTQIIFETDNGGNRFSLQMFNAVFQVSWFPTATYRGVASSSVSADTWYHIVGTVDASNNTALYVNGVAQSASYSAIGSSGGGVTGIGALIYSSPDKWFGGAIAHAKLFNVELTAAQALELYNNPEQVLPTGVAAANLKRYYPLCDYQNPSADSLNGLYVMDLGADKKNGKCNMTNTSASGGGMDLAESPSCPQLGLMPSTSRYLAQVDDLYTITQDSDINALFASGGSISFWICPFSTGEGGFGRLIDASNTGYLFLIQAESGGNAQLAFIHFFDGDDGNWKLTNRDVPIGSWSHIVVTYNSSDVANDPVIYVNGSSKAITEDVDPTGTVNADNSNKIIGNQNGNGRAFDGYISECAMWKTVLDADAVTAIYNSGTQGFDLSANAGNYDNSGDLKGWWKFNNAFTVQDLTSYNNDAVASGSPVLSTIPEATTAGTTLFGNTEEKRADNAVVNLNGGEYVTIPHDVNTRPDVDAGPTGRKGWTLSVWAKMRNFGTTSNPSMFSSGTGSSRWYFRIRGDSASTVQYNFGIGSANRDVDEGAHRLPDTDWHHHVIVLESDGTSWTVGKMWFDGVRVQSSGSDFEEDISALGSNDCATTTDITIGGASAGNADWDGAIAYPKIYAQALVENEIKLLYSSGHRVVGGL